MNKNLRKRKLKALMKIALTQDIILQDSDLVLNPKKNRLQESLFYPNLNVSEKGYNLYYEGIFGSDDNKTNPYGYLKDGSQYHVYKGSLGLFQNINLYLEVGADRGLARLKEILSIEEENFAYLERQDPSSLIKDSYSPNDVFFSLKESDFFGKRLVAMIEGEQTDPDRPREVVGSYSFDLDSENVFDNLEEKIKNKSFTYDDKKKAFDEIIKNQEEFKNKRMEAQKESIDKLSGLISEFEESSNPRNIFTIAVKQIEKFSKEFLIPYIEKINKKTFDKKCVTLLRNSFDKFINLKNITFVYGLNKKFGVGGVYFAESSHIYARIDSYNVTFHEIMHHWDECFRDFNSSCSDFIEVDEIKSDVISKSFFKDEPDFEEFLGIYNSLVEKFGVDNQKELRDNFLSTINKLSEKDKAIKFEYYFDIYNDMRSSSSSILFDFDYRNFSESKQFAKNKFLGENYSIYDSLTFHDLSTTHLLETYRMMKSVIEKYSLDKVINYKNIYSFLTVSGPFKKEYYNEDLVAFSSLIKPTENNINKLLGFRNIVKADKPNLTSKA